MTKENKDFLIGVSLVSVAILGTAGLCYLGAKSGASKGAFIGLNKALSEGRMSYTISVADAQNAINAIVQESPGVKTTEF